MEWRHIPGEAISRAHIIERFDLRRPLVDDDRVGEGELGLDVRYDWRGKRRHELHRWPLSWKPLEHKTIVDIGGELPVQTWDD